MRDFVYFIHQMKYLFPSTLTIVWARSNLSNKNLVLILSKMTLTIRYICNIEKRIDEGLIQKETWTFQLTGYDISETNGGHCYEAKIKAVEECPVFEMSEHITPKALKHTKESEGNECHNDICCNSHGFHRILFFRLIIALLKFVSIIIIIILR